MGQLRLTLDPSDATLARTPRARNAVYEAGASTRRTLTWRAPTVSPNRAVLATLHLLRDRSRAAARNDGYAKGAIDKLVSNIIGTGIVPLSQAEDPDFRRLIAKRWLQWTDESDADGQLDWYGQQAQAVRGWLEGGEVFIRLRQRRLEDGLSVPLQIQVLEPELCPHTYSVIGQNGNRIKAGIEFNPIGRRVAYWFHPTRPGDPEDFDLSQLRRVPAETVIHLYDPLRPGQLRGVPHLTQALVRLHELDKFDDATLLRQQLANLFVAFLKREGASDGDVHPLTGLVESETSSDRPVLSMEPGVFQELDPGEDVTFSEPPSVGDTYPDYMRQQLIGAAVATGVPYEVLTGDMSKVNDRTVRVILHEFRRRVMAIQHQIVAFKLCRLVWMGWLDRGWISGTLPLPADYIENPEPWARVKWMPQGWPYLHPVQDIQAQREAVKAGFTTRSAVVSEQGEDAEEIDRGQADDNARADELGLRYSSDGRQAASGAAAAASTGDTSGDGSGDGSGQASLGGAKVLVDPYNRPMSIVAPAGIRLVLR